MKKNIAALKQYVKNQFRVMKEITNKQNQRMNNMIMKLQNNFAMIKMNRIRRFHESINLIKILVIDFDFDKFE